MVLEIFQVIKHIHEEEGVTILLVEQMHARPWVLRTMVIF